MADLLVQPGRQTSDERVRTQPRGLAPRRRQQLVRTLQVLIFVLILGAWEGSARLDLIDPFFFSMPSQIVARLVQWFTIGTAQGSIWFQIWVTLEEAMAVWSSIKNPSSKRGQSIEPSGSPGSSQHCRPLV